MNNCGVRIFSLDAAADLASSVIGTDLRSSDVLQGRPVESVPLRELAIDSLSVLEFAIRLEEEWAISINPGAFTLHAQSTLNDLWILVTEASQSPHS